MHGTSPGPRLAVCGMCMGTHGLRQPPGVPGKELGAGVLLWEVGQGWAQQGPPWSHLGCDSDGKGIGIYEIT